MLNDKVTQRAGFTSLSKPKWVKANRQQRTKRTENGKQSVRKGAKLVNSAANNWCQVLRALQSSKVPRQKESTKRTGEQPAPAHHHYIPRSSSVTSKPFLGKELRPPHPPSLPSSLWFTSTRTAACDVTSFRSNIRGTAADIACCRCGSGLWRERREESSNGGEVGGAHERAGAEIAPFLEWINVRWINVRFRDRET